MILKLTLNTKTDWRPRLRSVRQYKLWTATAWLTIGRSGGLRKLQRHQETCRRSRGQSRQLQRFLNSPPLAIQQRAALSPRRNGSRFIDADPAEVRRILKEGDGRRRTAQFTLFLRCFGLIPKKY
ncbi:unnamed protein product, partial [Pylaiella littoralis]